MIVHLLLFALAPVLELQDDARTRLIAVAASGLDVDIYGTVYLLDRERSTLRTIPQDTTPPREIGGPGWDQGRFDAPSGCWARNGLDILVADEGNHRVQKFDRSLSFVSSLSTRESDVVAERFGYPKDVALSRMGDLFVVDGENTRVVKFTRDTRFERAFGGPGAGRGRLREPTQIEVGASDLVYVLDRGRVAVFDTFGNYLLDLGEGVVNDPVALFADDLGSICVDRDSLFLFDVSHRYLGVSPVARYTGELPHRVLALAAAGGKLYLLTPEGVWVGDDLRDRFLDKESKSR